jgi:hypothetical protein
LLHLLCIQFHGSLTEFESLLHKGSKLTDTAALVAKDFLGVCGANDNFGSGGSNTDFTSWVALFGKFTGEEFVELRKEDSISDELTINIVLLARKKRDERDLRVCPSLRSWASVWEMPQTRGARR